MERVDVVFTWYKWWMVGLGITRPPLAYRAIRVRVVHVTAWFPTTPQHNPSSLSQVSVSVRSITVSESKIHLGHSCPALLTYAGNSQLSTIH